MQKIFGIIVIMALTLDCAFLKAAPVWADDLSSAGGSVLQGDFLNERRALLKRIQSAQDMGAGVTPYRDAFDRIEESVKNGDDSASIKSRIESLSRAIDKQIEAYDTNNGIWETNEDQIWGNYCKEVIRKVRHNWDPPDSITPYQCVVTFCVSKDGKVSNIKITRSAGSASLDYEVTNAIRKAAPFGSWPAKSDKNCASIQQTFDYLPHHKRHH